MIQWAAILADFNDLWVKRLRVIFWLKIKIHHLFFGNAFGAGSHCNMQKSSHRANHSSGHEIIDIGDKSKLGGWFMIFCMSVSLTLRYTIFSVLQVTLHSYCWCSTRIYVILCWWCCCLEFSMNLKLFSKSFNSKLEKHFETRRNCLNP